MKIQCLFVFMSSSVGVNLCMLGWGKGLGAMFGQGLTAALNMCSNHTYTLVLLSHTLKQTQKLSHTCTCFAPSTKGMTLVLSEQLFLRSVTCNMTLKAIGKMRTGFHLIQMTRLHPARPAVRHHKHTASVHPRPENDASPESLRAP